MINDLFEINLSRKKNPQQKSYTNKLPEGSLDTVFQKAGEEAVEVILAANGQENRHQVKEDSDLFCHTHVLLPRQSVSLADVQAEPHHRHSSLEAK
jgi:phosphoribosyl-ATP pyrophosphohydrolase